MPKDNIKTRWHKVKELVDTKRVAVNVGKVKSSTPISREEVNRTHFDHKIKLRPDLLHTLMEVVDEIPKFYIEPSVLDVLGRADVLDSVKAMHHAGVDKLPFSHQLVEFDNERPEGIAREMIILVERDTPKFPEEEIYHPYRANLLRVKTVDGQQMLVLSPLTIYVAWYDEAGPEKVFGIHWFATPASFADSGTYIPDGVAESDVLVVEKALSALLVTMNTRGIEREVVEPSKLNRIREKSGKAPIPTHTVIKIGKVYTREGRALSPGDKRAVKVHWRKGHTRTQRIGKGRSDSKLVYIEPVLVNYVGGDAPRYEARVRF